MRRYLFNRLKEPSTWTGLLVAVTAAVVAQNTPEPTPDHPSTLASAVGLVVVIVGAAVKVLLADSFFAKNDVSTEPT